MSADIISKRARSLLADYLAANKFLKDISDEFEEVGIENTPDPGFSGAQRRTLIVGYYHSLNFKKAEDARKFVAVSALFVGGGDVGLVMAGDGPGDAPLAHRVRRGRCK